jgi:hypothetical protein
MASDGALEHLAVAAGLSSGEHVVPMVSVLYQIRVLLVERSEVRSVLLGVLAGSAERGAQLASG